MTTSSLVSCPICSKSVPEWYVSDHLDYECKATGGADSAAATSKSSSSSISKSEAPSPAAKSRQTTFLGKQINPKRSAAPAPEHALPSPVKRARPGLGDDMIIDVDNENSVPIQTTSGSDTPVISKPAANQPRQKVGSVASDLTEADRRLGNKKLPLAERLRPLTLDAFVGQRGLVGPGGVLRTLIESDKICSCIFWGNPGLGKTTLARIISRQTNAAFKEMSAVTQNISDVKKAIEEAGNLSRLANKRTIVFLDEIHRFNKAQQDVFLPYLERGQIILIGATTENPSFKLNGALLSRCRVFKLEPLAEQEVAAIAVKAAKVKQRDLGQPDIGFEGEIATYIAKVSDGDARVAIGVVDIAMDSLASDSKLDMECIRRALQRTHIVYSAEEHYDLISALHKSVRGSDANAALYWLGRMLQGGDDPLYIARRLVRMASEDIGLADNHALPLAMSTLQACQAIGMPECDTVLAHCVVYLARAPKSVESYMAFKNVKACVDSEHPWPVPMHIRNAPTRMMKQMGYGDGYKYNPDHDGAVDQKYLPEAISNYNFFDEKYRTK